MTERQERKISALNARIDTCLRRVQEDPEDGVRWLKHLIMAEQIRALKRIRPLLPSTTKEDDERAEIVRRVTSLYAERARGNIQDQIDWISSLLGQEGAVRRDSVDYNSGRFLGIKPKGRK